MKKPTLFELKYRLRGFHSILHRRPLTATFFVTNRCNFRCDFCDYPLINNDKKHELTLEEFETVGQKMAKMGIAMVAIIGGEPFIRKDLADIVRILSKHVMVQITTNGWFVNEENARAVYEAGVYMVSVSLDSATPDIHNKGRGNPRSYERVINAVKLLRDAPKIYEDQLAGFESILSWRNYNELEDMVKLANDLGVYIVFQPFSDGHFDGELNDKSLVETDVSAEFAKLKSQYTALYNDKNMFEKFTPFFKNGGIPDCLAGISIINIDSYGYMTRCEEQTKRYANFKEDSVKELLNATIKIHQDTLEDKCTTCYLRTRGETESIYDEDFGNFINKMSDMFNNQIPPVIPKIARIPGVKKTVRVGLDIFSGLFLN